MQQEFIKILLLTAGLFVTISCKKTGPAVYLKSSDSSIEVRFRDVSNSGTVEAVGIDSRLLNKLRERKLSLEQWQRVFPVFVGKIYPEDVNAKPPILGTYKIENQAIYFKPRFPFRLGLAYYARFDFIRLYSLVDWINTSGPDFMESTFLLEKPTRIAPTTVTNIFPSTDVVPANLLRFYIHFSAPMGLGNAHDYVHLLNSRNEEVALPFVEVEEGLWDRDRKRLTLFFHPGRLKRGVAPNLNMGPPLRKGETFRLIVDRNWKDAYGNPLEQGFQKEFKVAADDRGRVSEKEWRVTTPSAGTRQPLILNFPDPLDHALLSRMILIVDARGNSVMGITEISKSEMHWEFIPDSPWASGNYSVAVNTALEDLAGNNLNGVFDREMNGSNQQIATRDFVKLHFGVTKH
ncbi:hypothetical protein IH799_07350 [candidate division KSB1 bacterium]|nr:hypothetical protein [candidate division KSB1 bacterium]